MFVVYPNELKGKAREDVEAKETSKEFRLMMMMMNKRENEEKKNKKKKMKKNKKSEDY